MILPRETIVYNQISVHKKHNKLQYYVFSCNAIYFLVYKVGLSKNKQLNACYIAIINTNH